MSNDSLNRDRKNGIETKDMTISEVVRNIDLMERHRDSLRWLHEPTTFCYELSDEDCWFPDPRFGVAVKKGCDLMSACDYDTCVAIGASLSPDRLEVAYSHGYFPWGQAEDDLKMWHAPIARYVLFPDKVHVSHSMRTLLNKNRYVVTINMAFPAVIRNCGEVDDRNRMEGYWLGEEIIEVFTELYRRGKALSVEVWDTRPELPVSISSDSKPSTACPTAAECVDPHIRDEHPTAIVSLNPSSPTVVASSTATVASSTATVASSTATVASSTATVASSTATVASSTATVASSTTTEVTNPSIDITSSSVEVFRFGRGYITPKRKDTETLRDNVNGSGDNVKRNGNNVNGSGDNVKRDGNNVNGSVCRINDDWRLVGGLYGYLSNRGFLGDSMFSRVPSASKIALIGLSRWLQSKGDYLIDLQIRTEHLESMGGEYIDYARFMTYVNPEFTAANPDLRHHPYYTVTEREHLLCDPAYLYSYPSLRPLPIGLDFPKKST